MKDYDAIFKDIMWDEIKNPAIRFICKRRLLIRETKKLFSLMDGKERNDFLAWAKLEAKDD